MSARRPRVVLATEASGGGVGRHVLDLAEGLPSRGFDVLLLHARRRLGEGFAERVERHREFGYAVAEVDVARSPGLGDVRATRAMRGAVRAFGGADVLHGHSSKAGALARLGRMGVARRVVYTPNGWYTQNAELKRTGYEAYRAVELGLSLMTDAIVSVSSDEREHAVGLGIASRKLVLIENGIEPWSDERVAGVRRAARARLDVGEDDVVVGFLGRLAPQKAPEVALRVFQRVLAASPNARPVMVGDGPLAPQVRDSLAALGLADRVRWLPDAYGPDTIPAFDIFLMTSIYEGFPYTLLEALSSSCAIVTTRVAGVAESVVDGVNGHVVDGLDDAALAAQVIALCADRDRLQKMRGASRERASLYTLDRMVDKTAALYRSL